MLPISVPPQDSSPSLEEGTSLEYSEGTGTSGGNAKPPALAPAGTCGDSAPHGGPGDTETPPPPKEEGGAGWPRSECLWERPPLQSHLLQPDGAIGQQEVRAASELRTSLGSSSHCQPPPLCSSWAGKRVWDTQALTQWEELIIWRSHRPCSLLLSPSQP